MSVLGVNHLNIRTPDFTRTVAFLRDALGMKVTPRPESDSIERVAWVYDASGAPLLHLASADVPYSPTEVLPAPPPRGSGAIHHVALACSDFEAMRSRLVALDIGFRESYVPETGVRQIFVRDPTDILVELNFNAA